jgi:hypothetical protein
VNPAHLHLMLNHLPVIGVPLVGALLACGLFRRSRELYRTALVAAVVVAAFTYPVFLTGEPAEDRVEDTAWASKDLIHEHEERAEAALIAVLVTGGIAAFGLWQSRGGREGSRLIGGLTLAGLAVGAGLLAWTALAGGPIRHDEIRAGNVTAAPAGNHDDD